LDINLSENIQYIIGLACGSTLEIQATEDILWKNGLSKSKVAHVKHRQGQFPGKFKATLKDGSSKELLKYAMCESYGRLRLMYAPYRCHLCPDYSAEFADLSVADIMLRKSDGAYIYPGGRTVTRCRTDIGVRLIKEMEEDGVLSLAPLPSDIISKNFGKMTTIKKTIPFCMISRMKKKSCLYPHYNTNGNPPTLRHNIIEMIRTPTLKFLSSPLYAESVLLYCFRP
jgi:coenzyme F420 hydrogenase subunit beta